jgi:hypothetical protein
MLTPRSAAGLRVRMSRSYLCRGRPKSMSGTSLMAPSLIHLSPGRWSSGRTLMQTDPDCVRGAALLFESKSQERY